MHDQKTKQQFIELRVRGRSYARIAEELQVSRRTLIDWGRKFQFEIHNARVVEMEALRERFLVSREEQVRRLGERLAQVEAELAGRGVAELAASLAKVYGPAADPSELHRSTDDARCRNGAETVQFSLRKTLAIEETLAQCELWMAQARQSFARYQQFQPHRRLSLGMAVRLISLAVCREAAH